jgi:hypothetical protein
MKFFMPLFALALQILLTAGALAQTSGSLRMAAQNPALIQRSLSRSYIRSKTSSRLDCSAPSVFAALL